MEKTGTIHVDLEDTAKLTWIEYKLEQFVELIKERLPKIVQPKETVSDFDKSMWFTSIIVLLGKVLPANRFIFRIIEDETKFIIQLHDPAQMQQPQEIEVPYRKVFDWGVESWEKAMMLCKKDRDLLYSKWREAGMAIPQIADHFNISTGKVYSWTVNRSVSESYDRSSSAVIKRVMAILEEVGLTGYFSKMLKHACECKMDRLVPEGTIRLAKRAKYTSSDMDMCLDIAILYIEDIINNIKEINKLPYSNESMKGTLAYLSHTTGFSIRGKQERCDNVSRQHINHEGLEKCIDFFNKILEKLNNQRKELAA